MKKFRGHTALFLIGLWLILAAAAAGCSPEVRRSMAPTDATIMRYHARENLKSLEIFMTRLYAKNPRYEPAPGERERKIARIFHGGTPIEPVYSARPSHEVLTAAFAPENLGEDRVYLLGLGLAKSVREAYDATEEDLFLTGLQVPLENFERLHHNISQVNWRLKVYREVTGKGDLMFLTNEAGQDGYINMGYEVLMTEILTRIQDDIFLRGGLPGKYFFSLSTFFMSIVI